MTEFSNSGSLFDDDELVSTEVVQQQSTKEDGIILNERYMVSNEYQKRRMRILNQYLLPNDTPREGEYQFPKVDAYRGLIPKVFVPYNAKVDSRAQCHGVYCHIDDYLFRSTWTRPIESLKKVRQYAVAIAPDHTLWVDASPCENIEQLRRTRTTQRFWQNNGVETIQNASWGNAETINTFAFDGLAEESWTSIGHQHIGSIIEQELFEFGVMTLVERKHPMGLIIFGDPLTFDPGVPTIVMPSFIQKLRKL